MSARTMPARAFGVATSEVERRASAHRLADEEGGLAQFEVIEEAEDVVGEGFGVGATFRQLGVAEAALVEDDAGVALRQDGDLLPPAQMIAADAVTEHNGNARAFDLVEELDTVDGGVGHGRRDYSRAAERLSKQLRRLARGAQNGPASTGCVAVAGNPMEHDFRDFFERYLDDVHVGDRFRHWPGRTISQAAADQFCYWTSNPQPLHLDAEYAAASQHGRVLVNGILVFAIAVGLSVPNLSGNTIANLGFERVDHHAPTFIGDTIYAETEVLEVRASASRPGPRHREGADGGEQPARRDRAQLSSHLHVAPAAPPDASGVTVVVLS